MELQTEDLNDIIELESKIKSSIQLDANNIYFHYHHEGVTSCKVDVITINPNHKEKFLFHSTEAATRKKALEQALEYCLISIKNNQPYTVQWKKKGDKDMNNSYFYCQDMIDVIDKFYYGHDRSQFIIYLIKMNPLS